MYKEGEGRMNKEGGSIIKTEEGRMDKEGGGE